LLEIKKIISVLFQFYFSVISIVRTALGNPKALGFRNWLQFKMRCWNVCGHCPV